MNFQDYKINVSDYLYKVMQTLLALWAKKSITLKIFKEKRLNKFLDSKALSSNFAL